MSDDRNGMTPVDPPMADYPPAPPMPPSWSPSPAGEPPGAPAPPDLGLIGVPIRSRRAFGTAVLAVFIIQVFAVIGAVVLQLTKSAPDWMRGLGFGTLTFLGYLLGLAAAVALTRPRHVRVSAAYGFRGLPAAAVAGAFGVAVAARVIGAVWAAIILGLKIKLPGMDIDPTAILPSDPLSIAITFVLFSVLAPFVEEIVFRGILQGGLSQHMGPIGSNVWASVLFSLLHFSIFGIVPIFIASLAFGWLFQRTRTLWATVLAHGLFNGIGLVLAYALKGYPG
ncbi:MAG: CPBP family intramembrane metalloprotease [Coriobacteriales bacterium]|nr:CPBP family intramembrane metalloprotease [Coriobacteriales bacterium]